jgi:K+-transporting ATPase c subunit
MNSGEVVMSNTCRVVHRVRRPEAPNGRMNISRYISKGVLLLAVSLVICCGLYTLSLSVIGQGIFPVQANSSTLNSPAIKVVGSRQVAQPFTKDDHFQSGPSAASYGASVSTSSAMAPSNNLFDQNREFDAAGDALLQRPTQRVCSFYDC